jgi:hypothetical protein
MTPGGKNPSGKILTRRGAVFDTEWISIQMFCNPRLRLRGRWRALLLAEGPVMAGELVQSKRKIPPPRSLDVYRLVVCRAARQVEVPAMLEVSAVRVCQNAEVDRSAGANPGLTFSATPLNSLAGAAGEAMAASARGDSDYVPPHVELFGRRLAELFTKTKKSRRFSGAVRTCHRRTGSTTELPRPAGGERLMERLLGTG